MADPTHRPNADDDIGVGTDRKSTTRRPRWQKVVGIVGLSLVLAFALFFILQATGVIELGDHAPGPPAGGH